jgi:hypothetical protein
MFNQDFFPSQQLSLIQFIRNHITSSLLVPNIHMQYLLDVMEPHVIDLESNGPNFGARLFRK